jgi:hypothetical protein
MSNVVECNSNKQRCDAYGNAELVVSHRASGSDQFFGLEVVPSQLGQITRHARVTSRRFTRPDNSGRAHVHPAHFGWMDAPRMVAAGSWSGPSINHLSINLNGHAKSCFDFIDSIPSDLEFLKRVSDGDALVIEGDFGPIDNQVDDIEHEYRPNQNVETSAEIVYDHALNIENPYQYKGNPRHEIARFSSVNLGVSHKAILSHTTQCIGKGE